MSASLAGKNNSSFDLGFGRVVFLDQLEDGGGLGIRGALLRLGGCGLELDGI